LTPPDARNRVQYFIDASTRKGELQLSDGQHRDFHTAAKSMERREASTLQTNTVSLSPSLNARAAPRRAARAGYRIHKDHPAASRRRGQSRSCQHPALDKRPRRFASRHSGELLRLSGVELPLEEF
jgi:hypothetical protein